MGPISVVFALPQFAGDFVSSQILGRASQGPKNSFRKDYRYHRSVIASLRLPEQKGFPTSSDNDGWVEIQNSPSNPVGVIDIEGMR